MAAPPTTARASPQVPGARISFPPSLPTEAQARAGARPAVLTTGHSCLSFLGCGSAGPGNLVEPSSRSASLFLPHHFTQEDTEAPKGARARHTGLGVRDAGDRHALGGEQAHLCRVSSQEAGQEVTAHSSTGRPRERAF